jgi:hypothetical protein
MLLVVTESLELNCFAVPSHTLVLMVEKGGLVSNTLCWISPGTGGGNGAVKNFMPVVVWCHNQGIGW